MEKTNDKPNRTILHELFEFLAQFELPNQPIPSDTNASDANIWNELHVPMFRNFKVFVHQSGDAMVIAIPTHLSDADDVCYHVIVEDLIDDEHNGNYEIMSHAEFIAKYKCNYVQQVNKSLQPAKIADLADILVDRLPEIKKLKRTSMDERKKSVMYFSKIILNFLMGSKP